jgi:hypothetical protein
MKMHNTDLLFGVISGTNDRHFLLADIDGGRKSEIVRRVGEVCIDKHHFGDCYLMKTGRGWHIVNFTNELSLREYVQVLSELKCDKKFIWWVNKVKYGVLRISRRSSHWNVPYLDSVVMSPYKRKENEVKKSNYFGLLGMEKNFKNVQRVDVLYDEKDDVKEFLSGDLSSMRKDIIRVRHVGNVKKGKVKGPKKMGKAVHSMHRKSGKGVS